MALIIAPLLSLKRWAEQMHHRLQGHMLVTMAYEDGTWFTFWATDVYTSYGHFRADAVTGEIETLLPDVNITITGA